MTWGKLKEHIATRVTPSFSVLSLDQCMSQLLIAEHVEIEKVGKENSSLGSRITAAIKRVSYFRGILHCATFS